MKQPESLPLYLFQDKAFTSYLVAETKIKQLQARITELEEEVKQARRKALEEAAKVCEEHSDSWAAAPQGWYSTYDDMQKAADQIADAIRSLQEAKG